MFSFTKIIFYGKEFEFVTAHHFRYTLFGSMEIIILT